MPARKSVRTGVQKQRQAQARERTQAVREGLDEFDAPTDAPPVAGPVSANGDLGFEDEADGDDLLDDGDESGEPAAGDVLALAEVVHVETARRRLILDELLGSRPAVVLLRMDASGDEVTVRPCAAPSSPKACQALALLTGFVLGRFRDGRAWLSGEEWDELIGVRPAPLGAAAHAPAAPRGGSRGQGRC